MGGGGVIDSFSVFSRVILAVYQHIKIGQGNLTPQKPTLYT